VLELTESTLLHKSDDTLRLLHALKAAGTRLALDDFGTGFSSLSYLRKFPVDILKLDKSFVDDVATDAESAAVARAVIQLGEALGLRVIAEGVETAAQRATLQTIGCTFGQGYLFARPMPATRVITLLQTPTVATATGDRAVAAVA
jgi:EAL domain-containing protein (putative c-di-GMP-specific phosphodiesterase class I)